MVALATKKSPQRMASDIPCEKRLFRGTSPDAVDAICKQNFDWRVCGKSGTKYGEGSYFASNAFYSHSYATCGSDGFRFMFLARVLIGSFIKGEPKYRRPPSKDPSNPSSDLYDSCVDNERNPAIFVIFDSDQFYPEYVIKYFTLEQDPNFQARRAKSAGIIKSPVPHGALTGSASNLQKPVLPSSQGLTANRWRPSTSLRDKRTLSHSAASLLQPIAGPRSSQGLTANQWDSSRSPSANRALSHSASNLLHPLAAPAKSFQGLTANPKSPSTSLSANTALSYSIPPSNLPPPIQAPISSQALKANPKSPSGGLTTQRALSQSTSNLQQPLASLRSSQGLKANTKSPITTLSADRSMLHSASNLQQPIKASTSSQGGAANLAGSSGTLTAIARSRKEQRNDSKSKKCLIL